LSGNKITLFFRENVEKIKKNLYLVYLISRHPKTPFYIKILIFGVLGYAFSPIDLIPDFIPVIGYLDDLLIVPLGIYIALKLVPEPILLECKLNVDSVWNEEGDLPEKRIVAGLIILVWIIFALCLMYYIVKII